MRDGAGGGAVAHRCHPRAWRLERLPVRARRARRHVPPAGKSRRSTALLRAGAGADEAGARTSLPRTASRGVVEFARAKRLTDVPMKYLCLVYLDKEKWSAVPDRECANCGDSLRQSGFLLAAEPLHSGRNRHNGSRPQRQALDHRRAVRRDERATRGLLPDRSTRSERRDSGCREDPAGARGQHRGPAGQGAESVARPRVRRGQPSSRRPSRPIGGYGRPRACRRATR